MKALIWIACFIGTAFVQVLMQSAGIGGAIPVMLLYWGMYSSAIALCKKYDERKARKTAEKAVHSNDISAAHAQELSGPATKPSLPPIVFCRKCGSKLIEGSEFCSFCGTAVIRE